MNAAQLEDFANRLTEEVEALADVMMAERAPITIHRGDDFSFDSPAPMSIGPMKRDYLEAAARILAGDGSWEWRIVDNIQAADDAEFHLVEYLGPPLD